MEIIKHQNGARFIPGQSELCWVCSKPIVLETGDFVYEVKFDRSEEEKNKTDPDEPRYICMKCEKLSDDDLKIAIREQADQMSEHSSDTAGVLRRVAAEQIVRKPATSKQSNTQDS